MIELAPYDRLAAVRYAHRWAYSRNPRFYDYEDIGGDCTNFASQCLLAGGGLMNFTPDLGWYYIDANRRSPSWTGVQYLYQFLTRSDQSVGPVAVDAAIWEIQLGDLVQLSFDGRRFAHTPVVVAAAPRPMSTSDILIAAHSYDSDDRPLDSYDVAAIRYLHVLGVERPQGTG